LPAGKGLPSVPVPSQVKRTVPALCRPRGRLRTSCPEAL